ncbi:CxC2 domain-containing protein [Mycena kentingensis (nom. inval.)]|nr:CxC2 domain-containing protein [Mycena kentingensis (nom. inval.)]
MLESSRPGSHHVKNAKRCAGDGRAIPSVGNVAPQKRARVEVNLEPEPPVTWVDTPADNSEYVEIAATLAANDVYEHFIEEEESKRKRYTSSDDPMRLWREDKHLFLDHLLRHDGLGDNHANPACSLCDAPFDPASTRLFRPLHRVREWNGEFWTDVALHKRHRKDESPRSLNFEYQLGHAGRPCPRPVPGDPHSLVVMDVSGIFTLRVPFCGCAKSLRQDRIAQLMANAWYPATTIDPATCATYEALETFRLLNVRGNMSAHDYVGTLERLTDPTGLGSTPDRYKAFSRMSRQYQFLKRCKRSGVAHDMSHMDQVKPGGIAVPCWTCPQDGFNLPEGWDTGDDDDKFLYALMLAIDANFRLKNRVRANEKHDPSLGPGWGCFVNSGEYKDHLRDYVAEEDISTCIAFAALMEKNTKLTTGLRVSGVGGCVCARHGVVRAEGLGDLQKGERYANMDYILIHALRDARVKRLVLSYDIACQWKLRLRQRLLDIADENGVLPDLSNFDVQFVLPVWHAAAHEVECQAQMSFSHARGVGRTDGEGIERTWAVLNPISFATKEMGEGNRIDTIEDKVDNIGWEKNVKQGDTLGRKLVIAVAEVAKQQREFIEIDSGLEPDLRREWYQKIADWEKDATKPNPYVMLGGKDGPSEAEVAAELKRAEVEELRQGRGEISGKTTTAGFIKDGASGTKAQGTLTADRRSQIDELRASFFKKLNNIKIAQAVFMPGVEQLRLRDEERRDADLPPPKAEDTKLWLPSQLTRTQQAWMCRAGLPEVEAKLREAQCGDALQQIRSLLYTKTHLIHTRNTTAVGQAASTRSSTLIDRVGDRTERDMTKYNAAWKALRTLKGSDHASHFQELTKNDLHVRRETESDARARLRLGRIGEGRRARNEPTGSEAEVGAKGVSWIWSAVRAEDDEQGLHEAVRVNWSKALARRKRWEEEVRLLKEERRRVLRSLWHLQKRWEARVESRMDVDVRLRAGLAAYARRQVAVHREIAQRFYDGWHVDVRAALRAVLDDDAAAACSAARGGG